jgi:hypothetical protein
MKKILLLLLIILLTGCSTYKDRVYDHYYQELLTTTNYASEYNYDINITYDYLSNDELMYQVIIDNPKESISDLQVIVLHNIETNDIFPSYGFYGDEMDNNIPFKGINLLGYIDTNNINDELVFKVMVKYNNITNYHYIELEL